MIGLLAARKTCPVGPTDALRWDAGERDLWPCGVQRCLFIPGYMAAFLSDSKKVIPCRSHQGARPRGRLVGCDGSEINIKK